MIPLPSVGGAASECDESESLHLSQKGPFADRGWPRCTLPLHTRVCVAVQRCGRDETQSRVGLIYRTRAAGQLEETAESRRGVGERTAYIPLLQRVYLLQRSACISLQQALCNVRPTLLKSQEWFTLLLSRAIRKRFLMFLLPTTGQSECAKAFSSDHAARQIII